MRKIVSTSFILSVCFFVFTYCGDDHTVTSVESATEVITARPWKIQKVTIDDVDRTSSFNRLTLQFTGQDYSSSNGHVLWSESGTWSFSRDASTILRGDGVLMTVEEVSEHVLTISLDWNQNTFGDLINSIKGQYKFMFVR